MQPIVTPTQPTIPKIDTFYVNSPPIIKLDTIINPTEIVDQDTTICPVDTIERVIITTKVIKGKDITITKTVTDTVVVRITEKIPSIECPEVNPDNLMWKIITGATSLLFLIMAFIKRKKK
jgi:hypothetical protein